MPGARSLTLTAAIALLAAPGCAGGEQQAGQTSPAATATATATATSESGVGREAVVSTPGLPELATKNTTRVASSDTPTIAAAVALAVHPSATADTRPSAVTLVDAADWPAAISGAQLAGPGVRAPVLFATGDALPGVTNRALARLRPTGVRRLGGAQAIRVGTGARAAGFAETVVSGGSPAAYARAIDRLHARATGRLGDSVVVAPLDAPAEAMPAAGWAAKSGDPVLWARRDTLPAATVAAIRARDRPRIAVLGSERAIGPRVLARLQKLGRVDRIAGRDATASAIAFARFRRGDFGWGVVDAGHGLVLASAQRPADAAAAAPLSAAGSYGPLVVSDGDEVSRDLREFLLDIRPGYRSDPVRGVYNHAWLIGDATTISFPTQSRIDSLLEIQRVDSEP